MYQNLRRSAEDPAAGEGGRAPGKRTLTGALPPRLAARASVATGHDVSNVTVRQDGRAEALGTRAFARGDELHFAAGAYEPDTTAGRAVIAHELGHVAQQREGAVAPTGVRQGQPVNTDPGLEADADRRGAAIIQGFDLDEFCAFGVRAPAGREVGGATSTGVIQGADLPPAPAATAAAAGAPPEVLARVGAEFLHEDDRGADRHYRVLAGGDFELIASANGRGLGVRFAPTSASEPARTAWATLAAYVVAHVAAIPPTIAAAAATPVEVPAAPAAAPVDGTWSIGGLLGDAAAAVGGAVDGALALGRTLLDGAGAVVDAALAAALGPAPADEPAAPAAAPVDAPAAAPPTAGEHLSAEQVSAALAFYRERPVEYPPGVVNAIAKELGRRSAEPSDHTGEPDAAMDVALVDAVAAYQLTRELPPTGIADVATMKAMFGRDIRCRADAVDPSRVTGSSGLARVAASVQTTPEIREAWALLEPRLPATAYMSSGVRTWDKTVDILIDYVLEKAPRMIELGLTSQADVDAAIAGQDYATLKDLGNLDFDGKNYAVAGPGESDHITGMAFDIASNDADRQTRSEHVPVHDAAVKQVVADDPAFAAMFERTIPETGNRCVHVDLKPVAR
ncbi:MAG: DUF4157 domain-containing protein [Myxococcales bacterium]|nr:DUF4157 domain-containing protein [Myxococcales bacterium]